MWFMPSASNCLGATTASEYISAAAAIDAALNNARTWSFMFVRSWRRIKNNEVPGTQGDGRGSVF
jgi:hypothetical protein